MLFRLTLVKTPVLSFTMTPYYLRMKFEHKCEKVFVICKIVIESRCAKEVKVEW